MTKIMIPEFALVVLIGTSGSGKSTFAHQHFLPTEILSSDVCRAWVSDDETDQSATADAFEVLHYLAAKRLSRMKLTVIDATNVQPEARKRLVDLAKEHYTLPIAIVLDMPENLSIERNEGRANRNFGAHVIVRQRRELKRSLYSLEREGFRRVTILTTPEQADSAVVEREPLWNNRKFDNGPFDIIGDVHGCYDELLLLLEKLGYQIDRETHTATPPAGRKAFFVGDLVDRGPNSVGVLKLVMAMVAAGTALCVPGNHDVKLLKALEGRKTQLTHGLAETMEQVKAESPEFRKALIAFLDSLISHYVLDGGKLAVAHAGLKENMIGRASGVVREFALYGDTTGEKDEYGLPVRRNWALDYRGRTMVVYGHTPQAEAHWLNGTINIDTGCVFGGKLTALRYPERDLVDVPCLRQYAEPSRPFLPDTTQPDLTTQQYQDNALDIEDVLVFDTDLGKRLIDTRLLKKVQLRPENSAAALEIMSRFAVNPKWIVYLPPTMSPVETSALPDMLEHPDQAFEYYRSNGVASVICEEKHMGSRAVVVICQDEEAARERFGIENEGIGIVYTRTGRRFFDDTALESAFLTRVRDAITRAGLWGEFSTRWMVLDCELMPWSAKARELIRTQYAAVGAAATGALRTAVEVLSAAANRLPEAAALLEKYQARAEMIHDYTEAYRHYCWDVNSLDDLRLAPFHVLATEGAVHVDKSHQWHMEVIGRLQAFGGSILHPTIHRTVDLSDEISVESAAAWWLEMTSKGGEGMVVKPLDFIAHGSRYGLIQPAVKVRGREYLRIIYGAEYTAPDQLEELRKRGLGAKRSLALREFALGVEALERFVRYEPLRRVHECVFGVLALESEPIDPRL